MVYAIEKGASIIMYPEGTCNKSPNDMIGGLFPGIYDVAKASGAPVAPIVTFRNGKKSYGILGEAFDITQYEREEGLIILRNKMATIKYEIMEKYAHAKRTDFPYNKQAEQYWKEYIDNLMAEVKYYDYEIELHTKYLPKNVTSPREAFEFIDRLIPNKANAFLFRTIRKRE